MPGSRGWARVVGIAAVVSSSWACGSETSVSGGGPADEVEVVLPFAETRRSSTGSFRAFRVGACEIVVRTPPERPILPGEMRVSSRTVQVSGRSYELVRIRSILSPPPLDPRRPQKVDPATYMPESEVLTIGTTEIVIPRTGHGGCPDADVAAILAAITVRARR